jgi:catechol 2,3-dioxygenase-like lactoylglutathione lyase family enzyme
MSNPFVFMDLRTGDPARSRRFYTDLLDWTIIDVPAGPANVPMFTGADGPWGGLTPLTADDDRRPPTAVDPLRAGREPRRGSGAGQATRCDRGPGTRRVPAGSSGGHRRPDRGHTCPLGSQAGMSGPSRIRAPSRRAWMSWPRPGSRSGWATTVWLFESPAFGTGYTSRSLIGQKPVRWADLTRYVEQVRGLLRGQTVDIDGQPCQMRHLPGFAPQRPIAVPIWIAASGPTEFAAARDLDAAGLVLTALPPYRPRTTRSRPTARCCASAPSFAPARITPAHASSRLPAPATPAPSTPSGSTRVTRGSRQIRMPRRDSGSAAAAATLVPQFNTAVP